MTGAADVFALPPHFSSPTGKLQLLAKRALDLVGASAGLIVLAPLFGALALAVLADSGPPIFYRWKVVGRRGRFFTSYKFRTMVRDAEERQQALAAQNEMQGPVFKMRADPRVTRVGRLLRRYSLDELPQLWSVLRGDMSLVGPRPPLQREWMRFEPSQRRKLAVTPGITCLWQISGRSEIRDFSEWVRLDVAYIESWSLWLDLTILWRTLGAVLRRKGAY